MLYMNFDLLSVALILDVFWVLPLGMLPYRQRWSGS
jgi:hypothetical protein